MLPNNPPLILIVEDDIRERSLLAASLIQAGYRVSQAATGNRGLGEFAVQDPDAIVLDLGLPDIAGKEVVRQIRERSSVPILALADGYQDSEGAVAGADTVVSRPISGGEILAWLRQTLHGCVVGCYAKTELPFSVGDPDSGHCSSTRLNRKPGA